MKYVTVCTTIVFIVRLGSVIRCASSSSDIDITFLLDGGRTGVCVCCLLHASNGLRVLPGHGVTHRDRTALNDLGERPTAPLGKHQSAQPRHRVFHAFARLHFARYAHARLTDPQHAPSALPEIDPRDEHVGAPRLWAGVAR